CYRCAPGAPGDCHRCADRRASLAGSDPISVDRAAAAVQVSETAPLDCYACALDRSSLAVVLCALMPWDIPLRPFSGDLVPQESQVPRQSVRRAVTAQIILRRIAWSIAVGAGATLPVKYISVLFKQPADSPGVINWLDATYV